VDADLAAGVAAGDRAALEIVFKEHGGAVKGVAWRVLKDENLAEDIVQETFVTFWDDPRKYNPDRGTLRTFLLTIAHRKAVDVVRSEVARTRREQRPPDPKHVDVEEEVGTRDLSETVRRALDELSEDEREAIVLAYYGGLSYVKVAERLGLPEGTVKSRIRAGMKKLSTSLSGVEM
jgi:RNA polymerase sigma-70 factor (ECF subfamily)